MRPQIKNMKDEWTKNNVPQSLNQQGPGRQDQSARSKLTNVFSKLFSTLATSQPIQTRHPLGNCIILHSTRFELEQIELKALEGVKLRSQVKGIQNSEYPSSHFFAREVRRGKRKTFKSLKIPNRVTTCVQEIMSEQVSPYQRLLSKRCTDKSVQDELLELIDRKLNEAQKVTCEGDLTVDEGCLC